MIMNFMANPKFLKLVFAVLISITFASCQKQFSPEDLPNTNTVDSSYISKLGYVDPAGLLSYTMSFEYDNLKVLFLYL